MKKKSLYLFITIFSLFLFLAACDKNDENIETKEDEIINNDDDKKETEDDSDSSYNSAAVVYNVSNNTSYELIAGDEINPIYELVRKNYTYKSSDEEIFTVDKEGNVKTLKAGIAKLKIYSNSKLYAVIKIKVTAKDEVVYNCTEELYNEFKNKFDAYNMDNDLVFNAKITSSGINIETKTKMKKSPLYIEMESIDQNGGKAIQIIKADDANKKVYSYSINEEDKYIEKTYLGDISMVQEGYDKTNELATYTDLDYSKIELNKVDENQFIIRINSKEMSGILTGILDAETLASLKNNDIVLTMKFTFLENKFTINSSMNMHYVVANTIIDIPFEYAYEYSFEAVTEFDMEGYDISLPKTIDEVTEITENNQFRVDCFGNVCFLKHLEAGRYSILPDSVYDSQYLKYKIYDENKNLLDLSDMKNTRYLDNTFTVKEAGNYYFELSWGVSSDDHAHIAKLDNELEEATSLASSEGEIKDIFDIKKFNYNSTDEYELLKINNTGKHKLYLYLENAYSDDWNGYIKVDSNKSIYLNPTENTNIYVISAINDKRYSNYNDYNYQYKFEVEAVDASKGRDYDNLDLITNEYNDTYYLGYNLSAIKFKINASNKGIYKFYAMDLKYERELPIIPKIENIETPYNYEYNLEAKEYECSLDYPSYMFDIYQIRYEYVDISDKDYYIELNIVFNNDLSKINVVNKKIHKNQIVKYHFTLKNDSTLLFNASSTVIYDENNQKITPLAERFGLGYYNIKAGKYYAINNNMSDFYLGMASAKVDYAIDFANATKLELEKKYVITDSLNQNPYYNILLTYTTTESIELEMGGQYMSFDIYDEDFNVVDYSIYSSERFSVKLEANKKYYFLLKADYTTWGNAEIIFYNKVSS